MAIITDPDVLGRFDVVYNVVGQKISMYPIGDTQRNSTVSYLDAWVDTTGTLERTGSWSGVSVNDVVAIMTGASAGHYYVKANSGVTLTLCDIDVGKGGATATSLTTVTKSFNAASDVDPTTDTITITGHGLLTGDRIVYDDDGTTAPTGITDGTVYYIIRVDANNVKLASSYANAQAGTAVNITADGSSATQKLQERVVVAIFNNGANTAETLGSLDTSGTGDGDIADGVTLQCVYSYSKEEWRVDSIANDELNGNYDADNYFDNLIRYPFPFEAITSEQFEIGGSASHDDWQWFNDYTRKKVRTGGWAVKTQNGNNTYDQASWAGIITLGSLDADAQVYYQQVSTTTTPVNFTFKSTVNESVQVYRDDDQDGVVAEGSDYNKRTYLKLFVRKKGKTYSQSEIADIGVTSIQTIVNRFPLTHATDAAITATDGEILGTAPFRTATRSLATNTNGSKTASGFTFTSTGSTFTTNGVAAGDTLRITSGAEQGYYTIASVDSETQVTIVADFENTAGWGSTESSLTFTIYTAYYFPTGTTREMTDGALADVDTITGTLTSATSSFITAGVAVGDYLIIVEPASDHRGVYEITARTATQLTVSTIDKAFTTQSNINFSVVKPGMYLQYKNESVTNAAPTSYAFVASDGGFGNRPTITRASGTWDTSISAGHILTITSAEDTGNIGSFTVYARESGTVLSLVPTDVITTNATDTTAVIAVSLRFKRTINSVTYGFSWRLKGNDASLANCYQFVQHQLRQTSDVDWGPGTARGDITDLLLSFATPTGTALDMTIDDLSTADINNTTYRDATGDNRNYPFTAAGTLNFNSNLTSDTNAKYWLYFTNDDAGDNLGRDFGTEEAIIVKDASNVNIAGNVSAQATINFTYDYDGNVQRGATSAGTNAPVTLVAIGLDTAQYVVTTGTITRSTSVSITATAALERNYSNT